MNSKLTGDAIKAGLQNYASGKNMPNPNNASNQAQAGTKAASGKSQPTSQPVPPQSPISSTDIDDTPDTLINMNRRAKQGKYDEALFRDGVISKVLSTLRLIKHPNPLLIGEAGVGKTQIVEEIARRIENDPQSVPPFMHDKVIYELPIGDLIAGGGVVGEIEERIKDIIDFASDPDNNAIIYIDEIHQLYTEGSTTNKNIAQQLKPALSRGDLHVIASTTTQEARRMQSDPAIQRRFSRINVAELSKQETLQILENVRDKYQKHHNVRIPIALLPDIVKYADENINSQRPDSALTLLDSAAADLYMRNQIINQTQHLNNTNPTMTESSIKLAVTQLTSHKPLDLGSKKDLIDNMSLVVKGQDEALEEIADALIRKQLALFPNKKPASMLLAGPTGVGKTEIAKQIAKNMFGSESDMIYLNMTEFSNNASLTKLTGSPAGYVGSTSNTALPLDDLETNPYQVILLDEFEKAGSDIQNLFMQALDEGEITTQRGNSINFSKAIVIATSNAGQIITKHTGFGQSAKPSKSDIIDSLSNSFAPELINRFETVIRVNSISKETYAEIIKAKYTEFTKSATQSSGITFTKLADNTEYEFINKLVDESYTPEFNGRPATRTVQKYIENLIINNPSQLDFKLD